MKQKIKVLFWTVALFLDGAVLTALGGWIAGRVYQDLSGSVSVVYSDK